MGVPSEFIIRVSSLDLKSLHGIKLSYGFKLQRLGEFEPRSIELV